MQISYFISAPKASIKSIWSTIDYSSIDPLRHRTIPADRGAHSDLLQRCAQ